MFPSNPFATRFVAPGALPWIASPQQSLPALAARFQELGRQAAIVGPHGSGKSTLLAHLVPLLGELHWRQSTAAAPPPAGARLSATGSSAGSLSANHFPVRNSSAHHFPADNSLAGGIVWLVLRRRQRSPLPQILRSRGYWSSGGLLVLDGLEQLRSWEYAAVRLILIAARMGLLVTCHRGYRTLPCLIDTTTTPPTLQRLISQCLAKSTDVSPELQMHLADLQLIQRMLAEEQGSVREVFMRLYDVVEDHQQRRPILRWLSH